MTQVSRYIIVRRCLIGLMSVLLLLPCLGWAQSTAQSSTSGNKALDTKQKERLLEDLRTQRRMLERSINREAILVERMNTLVQVLRRRTPSAVVNALARSGNKIPTESFEKTIDLTGQLSNLVRRDLALAQAEVEINAVRDSLIKTMSPAEVKKLATVDYERALDWYMDDQFSLVEPLLEDFVTTYPNGPYYNQVVLMLGDVYSQLSKPDQAERTFLQLTTSETASSDIKAAAYFLLEDLYYGQGRWREAIGVYQTIAGQYSEVKFYDGAVYIAGDCSAQLKEWESAITTLNLITKKSAYYGLAQQQIGQCYLEQQKFDDAVQPFRNAASNKAALGNDEDSLQLIWTAKARLGHLLIELGREAEAIEQYRAVPQASNVYDQVLLALAWLELKKENSENATRLLEQLLRAKPESEYAYEAWVTLGNAYTRLQNYTQAEKSFQHLAVSKKARMLVNQSVEEERALNTVKQSLEGLAKTAEARGDTGASSQVLLQLAALDTTRTRMETLQLRLMESDPLAFQAVDYEKTNVTLASLAALITSEKAALASVTSELTSIESLARSSNRDPLAKSLMQERKSLSRLQASTNALESTLSILRAKSPPGYEKWLEDAEYGLINIGFAKYLAQKSALSQQYQALGDLQRRVMKLPKEAVPAEVQAALTDLTQEAEAIEGAIGTARPQLIGHLEEVLTRYPNNPYAAPMLFRLADVYYDQAERDFLQAQEEYERKASSGADPGEPPVPDYSRSIQRYQQLITRFPNSEFTDQGMFQLGHLWSEQGELDRANRMFEDLVARFPESPLLPDVYMRIGEYYFDSSGEAQTGGEGLIRKALASYQRVLNYPTNVNFQNALYKLGWAHYRLADPESRQGEYDQAVQYFTYLLEDSLRVAQYNQVATAAGITPAPLSPGYSLASEAIKYIAINFRDRVETGDQTTTRQWATVPSMMKRYVESIGPDKPYAKSIMKALGDVYKETGQVEAQVAAYDSLLTLYPMDLQAPRIMQQIIDGYEALDQMVKVDPKAWDVAAHGGATPEEFVYRARERMFRQFGRKWAESIPDTAARNAALTLSEQSAWRLCNYVARQAEEQKSPPTGTTGIDKAAQYFSDYLQDFPEGKNAYPARWNYAIYMSRLNRFEDAHTEFLKVSRDPKNDRYREEAARNAIAAAEKLLELEKKATQATPPAPPPAPATPGSATP